MESKDKPPTVRNDLDKAEPKKQTTQTDSPGWKEQRRKGTAKLKAFFSKDATRGTNSSAMKQGPRCDALGAQE